MPATRYKSNRFGPLNRSSQAGGIRGNVPRQVPFTTKDITDDRPSAPRTGKAGVPPQDTPQTKNHAGSPGRHSGFIAQMLFQETLTSQNTGKAQRADIVRQHPQGAALGSEIYRIAGAEPSLLSNNATFISIAV